MPSGLLLFNSGSVMEIGPATRLARIVGRIWTTTTDGSTYIPDLANGIGYVTAVAVNPDAGGLAPYVYVSGQSVVWTFDPSTPSFVTRVAVLVTIWLAI